MTARDNSCENDDTQQTCQGGLPGRRQHWHYPEQVDSLGKTNASFQQTLAFSSPSEVASGWLQFCAQIGGALTRLRASLQKALNL